MMTHLSVIIPTFNEEKCIEHTLMLVKKYAPDAEIIVVDGDSSDATVITASKHVRVIHARRGRGRQWPFMEDVHYSERMSKAGVVVLLSHEVETSARRHQHWGLLRTQLTVIFIRIFYLLKVHPTAYEWLWPPIR